MGGCSAGGATVRRWRRASSIRRGCAARRRRQRHGVRAAARRECRRWRALRRRARAAADGRTVGRLCRRRGAAGARRRPAYGDVDGGASVTIEGANFAPTAALACAFGDTHVRASAVSLHADRLCRAARRRRRASRRPACEPRRRPLVVSSPLSFYDSDQPAGLAAVDPSYIEPPVAAGRAEPHRFQPASDAYRLRLWRRRIRRCAARRRPDGRHRLVSRLCSLRRAAPASPLLTTVRLEQPRADGAVAAPPLPLSILSAPRSTQARRTPPPSATPRRSR